MTIAINRTPVNSNTIAKMIGKLFGAQYNLSFTNEVNYSENIY